jgi:hypothetical protein
MGRPIQSEPERGISKADTYGRIPSSGSPAGYRTSRRLEPRRWLELTDSAPLGLISTITIDPASEGWQLRLTGLRDYMRTGQGRFRPRPVAQRQSRFWRVSLLPHPQARSK